MKKSFFSILTGLLILGISGNAWTGVTATDVVCTGCVNDTDIASGAVTDPKIATGAVTTTKIADGAVSDAKITGPISASKIQKPANVLVVAKSGGDYATIQAAVDSVNPTADNPYVIKVMPGNYYESVTMKSYVHLQGAGRDVTRITYDQNPWYVIFCDDVVNVEISGFTLDGYGINNVYSSPTISNNLFKSSYWGGAAQGIYNYNASPIIKDNTFELRAEPIIHSNGSSSPLISGNEIIGLDRTGTGILVSGGTPIISNNVIKNMYVGIQGPNFIASDNLIEGNETGISDDGVPTIKDNIIRNNISYGIFGAGTGTAIGNTITGNGLCGIGSSLSRVLIHNKITTNGIDVCLAPGELVSFNIYDTVSGSGAIGNYNLKSDGMPAPLQ